MDFVLTSKQQELQKRAYSAGLEFKELAFKWDEEDRVDYRPVSDRMGALGLLGLTVPREYGGQGGDCMDYLIVCSEATRAAATWVVGEPPFCTTGPGPSMLMLSESKVLKEKYLQDVVTGRRGCAIALSEPDHGSDLTHLETSAYLDGDAYVVSGDKSFVTGALYNDLYATFVRFDGIPGPRGIGALLIESDYPGFSMSRGPEFVGTRGIPHGDVKLEKVRVPKENLIIGPGEFPRLMTAFNMERLHNASLALGTMMAAYDEAAAYVQQRHVFGRPVIEFQAVYHALADIALTIEAARLLCFKAAATAIDGRYPRLQEITMAKIFAGTHAPQVTMKCLELMGGMGVTKKTATQRLHREAITNLVAGGAPAVLKNSIAATLFPDRKFSQTRG